MGDAVKGLVGIVTGGQKPKTSAAPVKETQEASRKAAASRSRLLETEGGAAGEELTPDDVQKRATLLGN
jgi:hypothetical protein